MFSGSSFRLHEGALSLLWWGGNQRYSANIPETVVFSSPPLDREQGFGFEIRIDLT
jgi:hypothetical protein